MKIYYTVEERVYPKNFIEVDAFTHDDKFWEEKCKEIAERDFNYGGGRKLPYMIPVKLYENTGSNPFFGCWVIVKFKPTFNIAQTIDLEKK